MPQHIVKHIIVNENVQCHSTCRLHGVDESCDEISIAVSGHQEALTAARGSHC